MSDSLWLHWLQPDRFPCLSLSLRDFSNSCPLSQWCHPIILSSVSPFSFGPQSFPASRYFPMSQLFLWMAKSIRASASASVLPRNIQGWFSLELTWSPRVQGTLKSLLQHHNSKVSVLQCLVFFMVQLSHLYLTTGKTIALTKMDLCWQSKVSAF